MSDGMRQAQYGSDSTGTVEYLNAEIARLTRELEEAKAAILEPGGWDEQCRTLRRELAATQREREADRATLQANIETFDRLGDRLREAEALLRDTHKDIELLIPVALSSELPATADVLSRIADRLAAWLEASRA